MQFSYLFLTLLPFIFTLINENDGNRHGGGRQSGRSFSNRGFRPENRGRSGRGMGQDSANEVGGPVLPMDGEPGSVGGMPANRMQGEDSLPPAPHSSMTSGRAGPAVADVDATDKFSVTVDGKVKRLIFRLSNRLAVAVCDTYDNYLASGIPFAGPIKYNLTVQEVRSKVDPTVCQSFKIKRCNAAEFLPDSTNCGWTKVDTC